MMFIGLIPAARDRKDRVTAEEITAKAGAQTTVQITTFTARELVITGGAPTAPAILLFISKRNSRRAVQAVRPVKTANA